jgi:hypothetical protein
MNRCVCGNEFKEARTIQDGAAICVGCGRAHFIERGEVTRLLTKADVGKLSNEHFLMLMKGKLLAVDTALTDAGLAHLNKLAEAEGSLYESFEEVLDTFVCADAFDLARLDPVKADLVLAFVQTSGVDAHLVAQQMVNALGCSLRPDIKAARDALVAGMGGLKASVESAIPSAPRPHNDRAPVAHAGAVRPRRRRLH